MARALKRALDQRIRKLRQSKSSRAACWSFFGNQNPQELLIPGVLGIRPFAPKFSLSPKCIYCIDLSHVDSKAERAIQKRQIRLSLIRLL